MYWYLIKSLVLFMKVMHTLFGSSMNLILAKEIFIKFSADERYYKLLTNLYLIKNLNYHYKILNVLLVSSDEFRFHSQFTISKHITYTITQNAPEPCYVARIYFF
jgi:hypothetical protein